MSDTCKITAREASERTGRAISVIHTSARLGEIPYAWETRNGVEYRVFTAKAIDEWNDKRNFPRKFIDREKLLAALRRKQEFYGLTDGELAKNVGFATAHFKRMLQKLGQGQLPKPDSLFAILLWLEVDLKELQP